MSAETAPICEPALDAVLAEVDDDLRFLAKVIARMRRRSKEVDAGELKRAMRAVEARRRDPSLYLAVVGEFSSGKTSFTNVLLGESLLQTSPLANTAAITAIRQGPRRTLTARFRGDLRDLGFPSRELDARLAGFNRRAGTLEETLHILTCDEQVAPAVERVTIEHPSPLLGDDIVLLDTPGINSADDAHTAAALEAITRDADAFVVLIPSNAPVSMRLQALLRDHLEPFLHRTTFVVTRMTHVAEDERASVLRFVDRRLRREFGVDAPLIAASSLGAAMRAHASNPGATAEDREWLRAFEALRAELVARLRHERAVTVAERMIVLLREAMALGETSLRSEAADLRERAETLERNAPADLQRFCAKERRDLCASADVAVGDARQRVVAAVEAGERAATQQIRTAIDQAATVQVLDDVLDETPKMVEERVAAVTGEVRSIAEELTACIGGLARSFDDRFERQFRGLDRLAGRAFRATSTSAPHVSVAGVSADARAVKQQLDQRARRALAGGAGIGALIGTAIAPGIGTLIGAGLGSFVGRGGEGTSLPERRTTYWSELEVEVHAVFSSLQSKYSDVFDRQASAARSHLEASVERHRSNYAQTIRDLATAHATAQRKLERQRATGRRDAAELQARTALLGERAGVLTAMARARQASTPGLM